MSHLVSVYVVKPVQQHLHDLLNLSQGEFNISVAQQSSEVMLTEIKHQIDAALITVKLSGWRERDKQNKLLLALSNRFKS